MSMGSLTSIRSHCTVWQAVFTNNPLSWRNLFICNKLKLKCNRIYNLFEISSNNLKYILMLINEIKRTEEGNMLSMFFFISSAFLQFSMH